MKVFPESRDDLVAALAQWSVRKLRIPGVEEAIKPGSADRVAAWEAGRRLPEVRGSYERDHRKGAGRLQMNKEPRLRADFVVLPRGPLEPYIK